MKKDFIKPDLIIVAFNTEDIIRTSDKEYVPYDPEKDDWSDLPDTI